jgi:ADP-heptose:LPS heptosyltransferase
MAASFASDLLRGRGLVDEFRPADPPGFHTFFSRSLEPDPSLAAFLRGFDWVISYWADPDGVFESQIRKCGPRRISSQNPKPGNASALHAAEHLARPLTEQGLPFEAHLPLLPAGDRERGEAAWLLAEAGLRPDEPRVVVHPGSGSRRKNWPVERFAELVRRIAESGIGMPLLVEGPADHTTAPELRRLLGERSFPWLVEPPLRALAGVLSLAAAYSGNDSGVSHLAAAVGCPSVIIFGPTNPTHWRPLGPKVEVVGPSSDMSRIQAEEVLAKLVSVCLR